MKIYVIASEEYKANMPDMFLMDEQGNYYGVSGSSYAAWHNYPKSIEHWFDATGSDDGRYFHIDEVEMTQEQADRFDRITKEYMQIHESTPVFNEEYPNAFDKWPSKKAYQKAVDEWKERHAAWCEETDVASYNRRANNLWNERTAMFLTFSKKVTSEISDNDCIKYL